MVLPALLRDPALHPGQAAWRHRACSARSLILFLLPWLDTSRVRSANFRPIYRQFFWLLVIDCIILGIVGSNPPEGAWLIIGRIATAYYFLHFLVILPLVGIVEIPKPVPASIGDPVLPPVADARPAE